MSRFYVDPKNVKDDVILIPRKESHHIVDVMRLGEGDSVVVFDGTGKEYTGRIQMGAKKDLKIKIEKIETHTLNRQTTFTLAQAIPKRSKMDSIVEKATELGISRIIPIKTGRTVVSLDIRRRDSKRDHWRSIAVSASKQSGRVDVPEISPVMKFEEFMETISGYDLKIMACLHKDAAPLKKFAAGSVPKNILFMIGPEGDFSPGEIELARSKGAILVSLGDLVLKADTAGIYALSVLKYLFLP